MGKTIRIWKMFISNDQFIQQLADPDFNTEYLNRHEPLSHCAALSPILRHVINYQVPVFLRVTWRLNLSKWGSFPKLINIIHQAFTAPQLHADASLDTWCGGC